MPHEKQETNYPFHLPGTWHWFDGDFHKGTLPKTGNLNSKVFKRLTKGVCLGADRQYKTKEEAMSDYEQATKDDDNHEQH